MSIHRVNPNVIQPFVNTEITKSTTDSTTCEWLDVGSWTDKSVWIECDDEDDGDAIDVDINLWVSPKGAYELNNESTVDTEDYQAIELVAAHTAATLTKYDAEDLDDLQRPFRSVKIVIDNDDSNEDVTVNCWIMGWS